MKNNLLKGCLFVGLGASSYGMLATFVKMAYGEGFTIAEVTISQFLLGFVGLLIFNLFSVSGDAKRKSSGGKTDVLKLVTGGSFMGLTSIFYYKAVQYIPVGVGIVLLMQTVWIGVLLESVLKRSAPGLRKILAVVIILAGTALAVNLLGQSGQTSWVGIGWGVLAALSYTGSLYVANHVSVHLAPLRRSLFMILGGLFVILAVFHASLNADFSFGIFLRWGLLLSMFGTIIPPILFNRGFPLTGIGLGAIVASVEIPVSILTAHIVLQEPVSVTQWLGVTMILCSVVLIHKE